MKLWKTFGISSREDISYYDTAGEFEAERFAVNLNRMIMDEMEEKGKECVIFLCIGTCLLYTYFWSIRKHFSQRVPITLSRCA